jgi:hypothetical protein
MLAALLCWVAKFHLRSVDNLSVRPHIKFTIGLFLLLPLKKILINLLPKSVRSRPRVPGQRMAEPKPAARSNPTPGNHPSEGRFLLRPLAALLTILSLLAAPSSAPALESGEGHLGSSFYSLHFQTFGQQFNLTEFYGFLDFQQTLSNYGILEGKFAGSYLREPPGGFMEATGWQQAYSRLTLREFHWGRGVLQASGGDQSFRISLLPMQFTNFFYPEQYFRGFSLLYAHPSFQLMTLGGEVTLSRGLLGETFSGLGEALYGTLLRLQPWERLNLESGLFLTHDEKDYSGALVSRQNLVYRLAAQYHIWSSLYWANEFMQSFSEAPKGQEQQDTAYRIGGLWKGDRLQLEANYRDIGPRFHLINQIYQPDLAVRGYYLSGDVRPWPFLSMFGSYDSAQNNLTASVPGSSLNETEFRSAGLRFYRYPWPNFYWRYYDSNLATRSDFPVAVRGQTLGHYAELSQRVKSLDCYIHYEYFQYRDDIDVVNNYSKNAPLVGVRGYHQKFSWYLEGEYDRFNPTSAGAGFVGPYLKIGGDYTVSDNLYVSGEVGYRTQTHRVGGQFSVNWKLPRGFSLQAFGRLEQGNAGAGDFINNFYTNSVMVRLVKVFSWGRKDGVAGMKPGQEWVGSGSIEGWVFNDTNLNKALDAGEPGVAAIKIRLEDGSEVATDSRGYYKFPAVATGKHVVTLDARRIPAAYTFEGSETAAVQVQRRGGARVDFPFAMGASIRGRVLADPKGTGRPAPDAKGIPDVLVLLTPGDLNNYTDSEGYFAFEGVLPKSYELSLAPETLPEKAHVASPRLPMQMSLKPGEKKIVVLSVQSLERAIIFK